MRQRRVTGLDLAVLGTLVALYMLVQVFEAPANDRFDSYPEPVAALLTEVTAELPANREMIATIRMTVAGLIRIRPAVEALGAYRREAVQPLMSLIAIEQPTSLQAQEIHDRLLAMNALRIIGPEAADATPLLLAIVADPSEIPVFRESALEAAAAIGNIPPVALPVVLDLLRTTTDHSLKVAAIDAIGAIGSPAASAVPELATALRHEDLRVRLAAAKALGAIGTPAAHSAIPALAQALADPVPGVRMRAAETLAKFGPAAEPAVDALIGMLSPNQSTDLPLDDSVLNGEARERFDDFFEDAGADLDAVREGIRSDEYRSLVINNLRANAARTLASIGPAAVAAVPALIEATHAEDESVREAAVEAITAIRGG